LHHPSPQLKQEQKISKKEPKIANLVNVDEEFRLENQSPIANYV